MIEIETVEIPDDIKEEQEQIFESSSFNVPTVPVRRRRGRPRKVDSVEQYDNPAKDILKAVDFVKLAQKARGEERDVFCSISNRWVTVDNGLTSMAHPFKYDLTAKVKTVDFFKALSTVQKNFSISFLDSNNLAINTGQSRLVVNTTEFDNKIPNPDENIYPIDEKQSRALLTALDAASVGLDTKSTNSAENSVLVESGSAIGQSATCLVQGWHGVDLPKMLIPYQSVKALVKSRKQIEGFGYSGASATFWLSGGAWLKSQLWANIEYPNYQKLFEGNFEYHIMHTDFEKLIKKCTSDIQFLAFKPMGQLIVNDKYPYVDIDGFREEALFKVKYLKKVAKYLKNVALKEHFAAFHNNETIRGFIIRSSEDEVPF